MKAIVAIAFVLALAGGASAQVARMPPPANPPTRSASGQFVVYGQPPGELPRVMARLAADTNYIRLDPALVAVSCERIKLKLAQALGLSAPWQGKIYLDLQPVQQPGDGATVDLEKIRGGWRYRVTLPNWLERDRYVAALVRVLLLEMANRTATARPAEIPAWLVEGFARDLRASGEMELLLSPPERDAGGGLAVKRQSFDGRWKNPLEQAWHDLRDRPALTFEQLSWPAPELLAGPDAAFYRSCAQLFLNRLLRLENGPAGCRALLAALPRHLNWQIAFQQTFRAQFQSPLDVEKWWALQVVQFTGRELTRTWTPAESWRKFDEVIRPPVEVRAGEDELPLHADVSLQTILREWDRLRQTPVLQRKLAELDLLRPQVVPDLVPLVDDYRDALRNFLEKRDRSVGILVFKKRQALVYDRLVEATAQRLDALDAVARMFRPAPSPPLDAAAQAGMP